MLSLSLSHSLISVVLSGSMLSLVSKWSCPLLRHQVLGYVPCPQPRELHQIPRPLHLRSITYVEFGSVRVYANEPLDELDGRIIHQSIIPKPNEFPPKKILVTASRQKQSTYKWQ
ncbi:hypothetical protein LY76DRAFT_592669 [Colletotrichum caudatum]|nr:hypothetical protein LY76DRAFT_592669 [Colletotrichum caudatum]